MIDLKNLVCDLERIASLDLTEEERRLKWRGESALLSRFGPVHWLRALVTPKLELDGVEAEVELYDEDRALFVDTYRQRISDSARFGNTWEPISHQLAQMLTDQLVRSYDLLSDFLLER